MRVLRAGQCDSSFAGFDKQVDCYAEQLRTALDAIAADGHTSGGWGPMQMSTSADGVAVTPRRRLHRPRSTTTTRSSAPARRATGCSGTCGTSTRRRSAIDSGSGPTTTGWVGDPCFTAEGCSFSSAVCARGGYPNGMCTRECASNSDCPVDPTQGKNFCATFAQQTGYCVLACSTSSSTCRDGYACRGVVPFGADGGSKNACIPSD